MAAKKDGRVVGDLRRKIMATRKLTRQINIAAGTAVSGGTRIDATQLGVKIGDSMYDLYDVLEGLGSSDAAALQAEAARAQAAEAALQGELDAEVVRAKASEAAISTSMNSASDRANMVFREGFVVTAGDTMISFAGDVPADKSELVMFNGQMLEKDVDYSMDFANAMIQFVGFPGGALPQDGRVVVIGLIDKP